MDNKISAHRSVRRRHARRFVFETTNKRAANGEREEDLHQLVVGYPIFGGVYAQRAVALVSGRNREHRHQSPEVRGPRHRLCRVLKLRQRQHAEAGELARGHCHKRKRHTWRVTSHLSDCSGGMVFFRLGGSCHGRVRISRLPHQLSLGSGE